MRRKKQVKNPSFQLQAKNPEQALSQFHPRHSGLLTNGENNHGTDDRMMSKAMPNQIAIVLNF